MSVVETEDIKFVLQNKVMFSKLNEDHASEVEMYSDQISNCSKLILVMNLSISCAKSIKNEIYKTHSSCNWILFAQQNNFLDISQQNQMNKKYTYTCIFIIHTPLMDFLVIFYPFYPLNYGPVSEHYQQ